MDFNYSNKKKIDRSNRKNNTELVDLFLENKPSISKILSKNFIRQVKMLKKYRGK